MQCPGIGFGVARFPVAIPRKLQGRKQRFELAADVTYPGWRGKMLRFRSGKRAGSVRKLSQGSQALNVIVGALLFGVGCIFFTERPATVTLTLPEDVADRLPQGSSPRVEILWEPTGGNEAIISPRAAA